MNCRVLSKIITVMLVFLLLFVNQSALAASNNKPNDVTASEQSGSYVSFGQVITLSTTTAECTIYYTTDGSDPKDINNAARKTYESETGITIHKSMRIKAYAFKSAGWLPGNVIEFKYLLKQCPTQKLILEAMSSDNKVAVAEIIRNLSSDNIGSSKDDIAESYLKSKITPAEAQEALIKILEYTWSQKFALSVAIEQGFSPFIGNPLNFKAVKEQINSDITGNFDDDRGIKFMLVLLGKTGQITGVKKMAYDGNPAGKISLRLEGNNTAYIDQILTRILQDVVTIPESRRSFTKLLSNYELFINGQSETEIAKFKQFLHDNGNFY